MISKRAEDIIHNRLTAEGAARPQTEIKKMEKKPPLKLDASVTVVFDTDSAYAMDFLELFEIQQPTEILSSFGFAGKYIVVDMQVRAWPEKIVIQFILEKIVTPTTGLGKPWKEMVIERD